MELKSSLYVHQTVCLKSALNTISKAWILQASLGGLGNNSRQNIGLNRRVSPRIDIGHTISLLINMTNDFQRNVTAQGKTPALYLSRRGRPRFCTFKVQGSLVEVLHLSFLLLKQLKKQMSFFNLMSSAQSVLLAFPSCHHGKLIHEAHFAVIRGLLYKVSLNSSRLRHWSHSKSLSQVKYPGGKIRNPAWI